jgi:hypothetical protein
MWIRWRTTLFFFWMTVFFFLNDSVSFLVGTQQGYKAWVGLVKRIWLYYGSTFIRRLTTKWREARRREVRTGRLGFLVLCYFLWRLYQDTWLTLVKKIGRLFSDFSAIFFEEKPPQRNFIDTYKICLKFGKIVKGFVDYVDSDFATGLDKRRFLTCCM